MKLCLALLASAAYAQMLSPAELKTAVLKNFPLVEEASLKAQAAGGDLIASEGAFDTKLKLKVDDRIGEKNSYFASETLLEKQLSTAGLRVFGGHYRAKGQVPDYTGKYATSNSGELVAGLEIPLLRNRSIDAARTELLAAQRGLEISEQELVLKKNLYVYKALSTYEKWRLAHIKKVIRGTLLNVAEERGKMIRKKVAAGDVEQLRVVDNDRAVNKRQEELLAAELDLTVATSALGVYFLNESGRPVDLQAYNPPPYEELGEPTVRGVELNRIPQLSILDSELTLTRQRESLAANQRLPGLNFLVSGHRDLSPVTGVEPRRLQLGLQLEIPFENRKGTGKESAERAKALALEQQKLHTENELRATLAQAEASIRNAWERSKILKNELDNAQTVVNAERRRWAHGDSDLFVVTLREQDLADVQMKLWTAHYDYQQAKLDLGLIGSTLAE
jgi:outer membrane protein TolC